MNDAGNQRTYILFLSAQLYLNKNIKEFIGIIQYDQLFSLDGPIHQIELLYTKLIRNNVQIYTKFTNNDIEINN